MAVRFKLDENLPRGAEVLSHKGIWVLRPHTQSIDGTLTLLKGALGVLATEQTEKRLWVVEPGQVRIRE